MADAFQHLLLTRFNVRIFGSRGTDPDWLAHRFRFFERICWPSVMAQTVRGFQWLLFCDSETPAWALERLRSLIGDDGRMVIAFLDGPETPEGRRAAIEAVLRPGITHLVTSRLDNDDGLARSFIEMVQRQFAGQDFEFINFPAGHTCFRGRVYALEHPSSPFLSLVERLGGDGSFRTVFCEPHQEVVSRCPMRQVAGGPAWLQVIHGRNVCNMVRGRPRPLAELRSCYSADVLAAVGDTDGLWGRREAWDYWARRLAKKLPRWLRRAG